MELHSSRWRWYRSYGTAEEWVEFYTDQEVGGVHADSFNCYAPGLLPIHYFCMFAPERFFASGM